MGWSTAQKYKFQRKQEQKERQKFCIILQKEDNQEIIMIKKKKGISQFFYFRMLEKNEAPSSQTQGCLGTWNKFDRNIW